MRRRWSELTRVERVGLYTRQSLYVMLWSFNGSVLLAAAVKLDDAADARRALLGGGLVVTAVAFTAFCRCCGASRRSTRCPGGGSRRCSC